uniref:Uncharacterized protein n=1 Tax=Megaselia scalaris TaxID=36166 RepID=T1GNU0_MEGSC
MKFPKNALLRLKLEKPPPPQLLCILDMIGMHYKRKLYGTNRLAHLVSLALVKLSLSTEFIKFSSYTSKSPMKLAANE